MKKIYSVILLGLIILNQNVFAEKEQDVKKNAKKFTRTDIAKVSAATLGCAFCIYALLASYPTYVATHKIPKKDRSLFKLPLYHIPSTLMANILGIPLYFTSKYLSSLKYNGCSCHISYGSGAIISGGLAYLLGKYIRKKLIEDKAKKQDPSAKEAVS